ncbi:MAG: methyltransferase domain-containing protein [Chloroflexota bacterium]
MREPRPTPEIIDYEGSDYRTRFWEGQGREYEDAVERVALRKLLPQSGKLLLDLGAGFGRLANMYHQHDRVVLFDFSRSQLQYARERWGDDRFLYVAGDFYRLPLATGLFDTITQIRVLHHVKDVPALFAQLQRTIRPGGTYILEFANKRNLKAIGRYLLRRQDWSPFDRDPVEMSELHFNFHPSWTRNELRSAGFEIERQITISHFRLGLLKRYVPLQLLAGLDSLIQPTGAWWQLSPSVVIKSVAEAKGSGAGEDEFFVCPGCQNPLTTPTWVMERTEPQDGELICDACQARWEIRNGIFVFK